MCVAAMLDRLGTVRLTASGHRCVGLLVAVCIVVSYHTFSSDTYHFNSKSR